MARATLASLGFAVGMAGLPSELLARAPVAIESLGSAGGWRQYQVPTSDGVYVDSANDLLLARAGGSVYALSARCTHRGSARVAWQQSAGRFQCPKHKAIFSRDGVLQSGKPSRSLDRFAIRRNGMAIDVDLTTVFQEDLDPAAWEAALVAA
jgi:nitrite reductase/ring-hydroxylating ferredoxin subunit